MGFWEPLIFWILALGAVVTSIALLTFRNPLYSALALIADFFCFAGLYAMLSAHFLAIIQILVYAGAIMVLFVFIIMLLNLSDVELGPRRFHLHHLLAVAAGAIVFGIGASTVVSVMGGDDVVRNRQASGLSAHVQTRAGEVAYSIAKANREKKLESAEGREEKRAIKRTPLRKPKDPEPFVKTPSRVPGLYADISEPALRSTYREQLRQWEQGVTTPADRKYRPFDPDRKFEVPPAMSQGEQALAGESEQRTPQSKGDLFGTVEPISILLVNRFVVPFELTAVLLLAGIFGAVIIAKKRL